MPSTPSISTPAPRRPPAHPAHNLLIRAHSPSTAERLFTEKVRQKPLLLRPTSPAAASDNRARRRLTRLRKKEYFLRKQKPRPLSAKEKRQLGVYELKKEECKYAVFEGLHRLWVEYMQEVLGLQKKEEDINVGGKGNKTRKEGREVLFTAQAHGSLLASADFHGAEVEVVRAGCVDRVGLKGIVVRDTKFTFVIVTRRDEVKTIPKQDTIFRFEIPSSESEGNGTTAESDQAVRGGKNLVFELHGNQFEHRPADRASKKFKWKTMDYV